MDQGETVLLVYCTGAEVWSTTRFKRKNQYNKTKGGCYTAKIPPYTVVV